MSIFTGAGVAIVTPFHEDGSINYESYANLINFQIKNGADAIISCGTTGEAATLTDEEQIDAVAFAVKTVAGRVPVIGGAGSNNTPHGILLCEGCTGAGADGLLLQTPYYNKTTQNGLIKHFTEMAACTHLPILLYNIPGRTGMNIDAKTLAELRKIDNIIGIKEASSNFALASEYVELCGEDFDLYSGEDGLISPLMALGAKGAISVLANIAPRKVHDLVMKFIEGDTIGSLRLQLEALPLVRALFCEVNPIPIKAALNMMGFNVGGLRMPLVDMEPQNAEKLRAELVNYGLL
jgi:4-hydroxy-tetrahydrodipicolinate synthase